MLLQLMNNVLDTGKLQFGELDISYSDVQVHDFLKNAWIMASEIIRRKELKGKIMINKYLPTGLKLDHYRLM